MKKNTINGELLLKMSDSIIKSIKSSKEYRETVINVLDYMNNDVLNDLLELNEYVYYAVYDYISYKIGYMSNYNNIDFSKFTSEKKIEEFDQDYYHYCKCYAKKDYDRF